MTKKYPSKKDLVTAITVWGTILVGIVSLLYYGPFMDIIPFTLVVTVLVLLLWIWFNTVYLINETQLIYKFGPFEKKIVIKDIVSIIRDAKSTYGSGNLSKDRIAIISKGDKSLTISPLEKEAFIKQLCSLNKKIKVK